MAVLCMPIFADGFTKEISVYQPLLCNFEAHGVVTETITPSSASQYPIPLNRVLVEKDAGQVCPYQNTYTDEDGHYVIPMFTDNLVPFYFSKEGYVPKTVLVDTNNTTEVNVTLDLE